MQLITVINNSNTLLETHNTVIPRGTSADMERHTCADSGVAFVKKLRYRSANVSTTGSCISIVTASSSLSTLALCASFMLPGNSRRHHISILKMLCRNNIALLERKQQCTLHNVWPAGHIKPAMGCYAACNVQ